MMSYKEQDQHITTPSSELVAQYRAAIEAGNDSGHSLTVVHYRAGQAELELGRSYCQSADPLDRIVGCSILRFLGGCEGAFMDETVAALLALLADPDPEVIAAAANGLGERGDPRAIPHLLALVDHADATVRLGVVQSLMGVEAPAVIAALLRLARDPDRDVRSWVAFGLGSQVSVDSDAIRAVLWQALNDADHEIRGEALVGLAKRQVPGTAQAILREWETYDFISILSIEAAGRVADPSLLAELESMLALEYSEEEQSFLAVLQEAIAAVKGITPFDPDPES